MGADRISNLVMASEECNKSKDNRQPEEWLEELRKSEKAIESAGLGICRM